METPLAHVAQSIIDAHKGCLNMIQRLEEDHATPLLLSMSSTSTASHKDPSETLRPIFAIKGFLQDSNKYCHFSDRVQQCLCLLQSYSDDRIEFLFVEYAEAHDDMRVMLSAFEPKAKGAWHLHRLTEKIDLDFFVMFSSFTALIGNPGQANYVAANQFLDSVACHRQARKLTRR